MEYQDFIKKGAKVRYTYRVYDYYSATAKGWGPIPYEEKSEIVTIVGTPRNKNTKKFVSLNDYWFDDEETEILCKFEGGFTEPVELCKLSIYNEIKDLTDEELTELFNGCAVGSMFYDDYRNDFGVDEHKVCDIIEAFCESIEWDDDLCRACNFVDYVRES